MHDWRFKMIRHVFLDVDNTILDFNKAEAIALEKTLSALSVPHSPEVIRRYSQLNLAQWKLLEQGKLTREQVKVRRYRLLFDELKTDASPEKAARIYEGLLGQGHYFIDGAVEMLQALYGSFHLYLATNGTASVQKSRLKSAEIEPFFEQIFISEELGCNKPETAFFERCFAAIPDFKKEEAVMVGDSLTSDILGGIRAGIRTVWFNKDLNESSGEIRPDHTIKALSELLGLLRSM